jgi:hypothetical protein
LGIAYRCDRNRGITYAVWDGVVTIDEWLQSVQRQLADRDWPAGRLYLSDLRFGSPHPSIKEAELQHMAELYGAHLERLKVVLKQAIVAPANFKEAMLFDRFISKFPIKIIVFNDVGTACTWLGTDVKDALEVLEHLRRTLRRQPPSNTGKNTSCDPGI